MISKIQIAILIMSLIDLTASFLYISKYDKMFPDQDATTLEGNPILRFSMRKLGILAGMIVGGMIVFGIIIILVMSLKINQLYYLAGVLSMMLVYHLLNYNLLRSM